MKDRGMDRNEFRTLTLVVIAEANAASEHRDIQLWHQRGWGCCEVMATISLDSSRGSFSKVKLSQSMFKCINTADTSFPGSLKHFRRGEGVAFPYASGEIQLREHEYGCRGSALLAQQPAWIPPDLITRCVTVRGKQRQILKKICEVPRTRHGARDDESDEKV